jgi:hypothetical protein
MEQIMKTRMFLILILPLLWTDLLLSYEIENTNSVDIQVSFQKISHQNPWMVGEPFSKKGKAIHLGKGQFFTVTLAAQKPLFAEMDSYDYSVPKLKVEAYDPETGFTLLQSIDTDRLSKQVSIDEKSVLRSCKSGKSRYIQLPFSKTPIKAYLLEKRESDEPNFSFQNSVVCGITYQDILIPTEYIRFFLNGKGTVRSFPHPGWMYDVQLTPSEKKYYSRDVGRGILVSESFPGIGPAYSLFSGDVVLGINGILLQHIQDWDRYDRVMDLILRDSKGKLKTVGTKTNLVVYRHQQKLLINYNLSSYKTDNFLIPEQAPNRNPLYYILGGFFFTELTSSYIKEFGTEYRVKSEKKLVYLADFYQKKSHPIRERIVILSRVFPLDGNVGYQDFQDLILETVNGVRITSLEQLKAKIDKEETDSYAFEFSGGKVAIFTRRDLVDLKSELQNIYKIDRIQNLED